LTIQSRHPPADGEEKKRLKKTKEKQKKNKRKTKDKQKLAKQDELEL
tara:strand:- start:632 stop:772 length:141 start_codon:yes stop_codon:yes gene_type:complete